MERNTLKSASLFGTQRVGATVFSSPVSGFLSQLCCHEEAFMVSAEIKEHDSCSNLPSSSVINTITKNNLGRKWFNSASSFQFIRKGSQDRSSKQEPGNRNRREAAAGTLLTACSPWLPLSTFLPASTQDHLCRGGTMCSGLGPPHQSSI